MTADDEVFNGEIELTHSMRATMDVYWTGYAAGLMRARFGSVAVGDRYHDEWRQTDAPDDQARGYRDDYSRLERLLHVSSEPDGLTPGASGHESPRAPANVAGNLRGTRYRPAR